MRNKNWSIIHRAKESGHKKVRDFECSIESGSFHCWSACSRPEQNKTAEEEEMIRKTRMRRPGERENERWWKISSGRGDVQLIETPFARLFATSKAFGNIENSCFRMKNPPDLMCCKIKILLAHRGWKKLTICLNRRNNDHYKVNLLAISLDLLRSNRPESQ